MHQPALTSLWRGSGSSTTSRSATMTATPTGNSEVTVKYDCDIDDMEDMLSNDLDVAIARAEPLPEYVLGEQDDTLKRLCLGL